MAAFKRLASRCLPFVMGAICIATPCAAGAQATRDRDIRREIQWSHDRDAGVLVLLTDGRQLTGIVDSIESDRFGIAGEFVAFRAVKMVYRIVKKPAPATSQSHGWGISEKWVWITFAAYLGTYLLIGILGR